MEDFSAIAQIAQTITVSAVLLYAWLTERAERKEIQFKHNEDLREVAGLKHQLQRDAD